MKHFSRFLTILACLAAWSSEAAMPSVAPLGAAAGVFRTPARVAVDGKGRVHVTDSAAGQLVILDTFGRPQNTWTGLSKPLGVAVDAEGRVYVAEEGRGRVGVYSADGSQLAALGQGDGEFQLPNHIALDAAPAGGMVWVSDSRANRVLGYRQGVLAATIGGEGLGAASLDFPTGVCVSPGGEVFVVDQNRDQVQVYTRSGVPVRRFALADSAPSGRAQAICQDAKGRLYVVDSFQARIRIYDAATGVALGELGDFGAGLGQLDTPGGLALDPFGRLWVTSVNTRRLEAYGLDDYSHFLARPAAQVVAEGDRVSLLAHARGSGTLSYQWSKDGKPIPGETGESLSLNAARLADAGSYSVQLSGSNGVVDSGATYVAIAVPPRLIMEPSDTEVWRGGTAVLNVVTEGTDLRYQWQWNGANIPGATNAALNLVNMQPGQAGSYSVRVANAVGYFVSRSAQVIVNVPPSAMEIASSMLDTNHLFHLSLNVDLGYRYALDASDNLLDWQTLTIISDHGGLIEYVDEASADLGQRFYRLRWTP